MLPCFGCCILLCLPLLLSHPRGNAVMPLQFTRSGAAKRLLLASRASVYVMLMLNLLLITPSMGLQSPAAKHISQHVDAGMPLMGVSFDVVHRGSDPTKPWRPRSRLQGSYQYDEAPHMSVGMQHPSMQHRQYPNKRQVVPTDSRQGPDRGNTCVQQPPKQPKHPFNGKVNRPEQPNHQPWQPAYQNGPSAYDLHRRREVGTTDRLTCEDTRKAQNPQIRLEVKPYQLQDGHEGRDIRCKQQVTSLGCMLPAYSKTPPLLMRIHGRVAACRAAHLKPGNRHP
jgi:hypothetical protein